MSLFELEVGLNYLTSFKSNTFSLYAPSFSKQSNKIWIQFRTACDYFFNARQVHYKKLDKEKKEKNNEKVLLLKEVK
jgi:hypothetical protein